MNIQSPSYILLWVRQHVRLCQVRAAGSETRPTKGFFWRKLHKHKGHIQPITLPSHHCLILVHRWQTHIRMTTTVWVQADFPSMTNGHSVDFVVCVCLRGCCSQNSSGLLSWGENLNILVTTCCRNSTFHSAGIQRFTVVESMGEVNLLQRVQPAWCFVLFSSPSTGCLVGMQFGTFSLIHLEGTEVRTFKKIMWIMWWRDIW